MSVLSAQTPTSRTHAPSSSLTRNVDNNGARMHPQASSRSLAPHVDNYNTCTRAHDAACWLDHATTATTTPTLSHPGMPDLVHATSACPLDDLACWQHRQQASPPFPISHPFQTCVPPTTTTQVLVAPPRRQRRTTNYVTTPRVGMPQYDVLRPALMERHPE